MNRRPCSPCPPFLVTFGAYNRFLGGWRCGGTFGNTSSRSMGGREAANAGVCTCSELITKQCGLIDGARHGSVLGAGSAVVDVA